MSSVETKYSTKQKQLVDYCVDHDWLSCVGTINYAHDGRRMLDSRSGLRRGTSERRRRRILAEIFSTRRFQLHMTRLTEIGNFGA